MVTDQKTPNAGMANLGENDASGDNVARPAVVVTGASRGIGLAIARKFAAKGRNVAMVARDPARLEVAVAALARPADARCISVGCDITAVDSFDLITRELKRHGLYLDVLVNCAGTGLGGPFVGQPVEELARLTSVNIEALMRLTRLALPEMIARRGGGIINVSSLGAHVPGPNQAAYYASKSFVLSLTEALASETSGSGVSIAAVLPGPVDTEFHASMGAERALYRSLLPSMSADAVAASTVWGFEAGHRIIVPGFFNKLAFVALRLTPHILSVPMMGLLLRRPRA